MILSSYKRCHFEKISHKLANYKQLIINHSIYLMKSIRLLVTMLTGWLLMVSASAETSVQLIGFMETNSEWLDSSDPTAAYGFYGFSPTGEGGFKPLSPTGPDNTWANCGGTYANGKFYCYNVYGSWTNYTLTYRVIDASTWNIVDSKSFNFKYSDSTSEESVNARNIPTGIAYDPISDTIWAVTHAYSNTESVKLCRVDTETGRLIVVAELPAIRIAACDVNGNLYGIGLDSKLYTIGKDGNCTEIGSTGFYPSTDSELKTGATIDFRTGKMYWSCYGFSSEEDRNWNRNSVNCLLEINVTTAESTVLFNYPSGQRFSSLSIANAHPLAPDNITDLIFTPNVSDRTKGTLSFSVPEVTFSQKPLSAQVNMTITLDGTVIEERTAAPGEKISKALENLSDGTHNLSVKLNANGHDGFAASTSFYVGAYVPDKVTDLTLSYDKDTDSAVLTWSTPADAHGGIVDTSKLRYRIERSDGVLVARSAKGNSFTEKATFPWDTYYYTITPYAGNETGPSSRSNSITFGAPRELPFEETFDTSSSINVFTRIDANGDGNGSDWDTPEWLYDEQYACAFYYGKRDQPADDWLITPSLKFEEGYVYKLTFKYYAYYGYGSKFRVVVGSKPNVENMDFEVLYKETVSSFSDKPGITETVYFAPRKGDSFIGFHHISETMEHLSIDDIVVESYCSADIPDKVANLTATKTSDTEVTLTFDLPSTNAGRQPLNGPLTVSVYKDGSSEATAVMTGKNPGEKITWKDSGVTPAVHTYLVRVSNDVGNGYDSEVSIDTRKGTPVAVESVRATLINDSQIYLEWPASVADTDEEGKPVDVTNIRYLVYKPVPDADGNVEYRIIARDLDVCHFIDGNPREGLGEGPQYVYYYVAPINGDDEGYATASNSLLLADGIRLPYAESWPNQTMENGNWYRGTGHGATWYIRYKGYDPLTDAYDGTGVASCETDRDMTFGMGTILSPRLDLSLVQSPSVTFYMYQSPEYESGVQLAVGVDIGDGAQHLIPGALYNAHADEAGWKEINIPLDDFTSYKSASIAFYGYVTPENTIHIDNVSVKGTANSKEVALTGIVAPVEGRTGIPVTFNIDVTNKGAVASGSFAVEMTYGTRSIGTKSVSPIQPDDKQTVSFTYTPADEDAGKILDLKFNIINCDASDTNPANNSLMTKLEVKASNSYRVSRLNGAVTENGIELQWRIPDECDYPESVLDNVECHKSYAIDNIGNWTMHDGDNGYNYLMSDGAGGTFEWENCHQQQAFIVFDTTPFESSLDAQPVSGSKFFAAWPVATASANDDWLISPELPGCAQLISFYARSLKDGTDAIEVLVSDSDTEPASFTSMTGAEPIKVGASWNLHHFALPEGTRHFAIRYIGENGEGIMIDDIMYFGTPIFTPDGYNVYRNGIRINNELVKEPAFIDTDLEDYTSYRYTVAPVCNGVEMPQSDELILQTTAISSIGADASIISINTVTGGVEILGAAGQPIAVYAIDGKCMASQVASDRTFIALAPGAYIVSAGNAKSKVMVK